MALRNFAFRPNDRKADEGVLVGAVGLQGQLFRARPPTRARFRDDTSAHTTVPRVPMNGRQHLATGIIVSAAAGPVAGVPILAVLTGGAAMLFIRRRWARRISRITTGTRVLAVLVPPAVLIGVAIACGIAPTTLAIYVACATVSALAPDIDHQHSTISGACPPLHRFFRIAVANPVTSWLWGAAAMRSLREHRQLSHTLVALPVWVALVFVGVDFPSLLWGGPVLHAIAGGLPAWTGGTRHPADALALFAAVGCTAGYASHIAGDMMTPSGVALLPWSSRRYWLLPRSMRGIFARRPPAAPSRAAAGRGRVARRGWPISA
jgi:membrane-bound metal-dependent hydrolase YbcI (DUF457 family)